MPAVIELQIASSSQHIPRAASISDWVNSAIETANNQASASTISTDAEVSIRVVDNDESRTLNREYRHQDKPTNVLSFPAELDAIIGLPLLGDLVICAPVVEDEAQQQQKTLTAHWAHMVIHGILHLIGYDHIDDSDAEVMEALETQILINLGFNAPYEH